VVPGGNLDAGDVGRDGRQQAPLERGGQVGVQGGSPLGGAAGDISLDAGLDGVGQETLTFVVGDTPVGDIGDHADEPRNGTVAIEAGSGPPVGPPHRAVGAKDAMFGLEGRPGDDRLFEDLRRLGAVLGMDAVPVVLDRPGEVAGG